PNFTPSPSDGGDAEAEAPLTPPKLLACMGTTCPEPYGTCSSTPSFKCGTNLMNDPQNCGACGVSCDGYEPINMSASCVDGECAFECQMKKIDYGVVGTVPQVRVYLDCNGLLDDGCEIESFSDPKNCGFCGNTCNNGEHCINGKCGCSGGKV